MEEVKQFVNILEINSLSVVVTVVRVGTHVPDFFFYVPDFIGNAFNFLRNVCLALLPTF